MWTDLLSPLFAVIDFCLDAPQAFVVVTSVVGIAFGILFMVR